VHERSSVPRVVATAEALAALAALGDARGPLVFYQSGGCCGGSLPMCFDQGEFVLGDNDLLLGYVGGCPFYMDPRPYATWAHTQIILDVGDGEPEGFSLATLDGRHFVTRSRVFSPDEFIALAAPVAHGSLSRVS
jgi:uncharacterized protein